jgi:spermidine/putrescine transport system permease protein
MPGRSSKQPRIQQNRHEASARRRRRFAILLLIAPAVLLIVGALIIPAAILLAKSFFESLGYGQVSYNLTLSNYLDSIGNPVYRKVAYNALGIGGLAALICVVAGYPVAYFITFRLRRGRNLALFLVVISLFSSYLVRIYAWRTILGQHGVINDSLIKLGVIDHPLLFLLFSRSAVLIAFVNVFLPYSILILTSAMQNVPRDLLENARDLGATSLRTFSKVLLPLTMTGAVGAFTYTFILCVGDYITPQLLGGKSGTFIGTVVSDQFLALGNQPVGAAISFMMLVIFFVTYLGLSRLERFKGF